MPKISNERKLLYNCGSHEHKKYRLHSVSGDSVFIESDSVHSAHVTATPFLSLIPPFLLRSCILPLRFCDPRWLHLYKERKGEMKLSGCTGDQENKATSLSQSSRNEPKNNQSKQMEANTGTRDFLDLCRRFERSAPDSGDPHSILGPVFDIWKWSAIRCAISRSAPSVLETFSSWSAFWGHDKRRSRKITGNNCRNDIDL